MHCLGWYVQIHPGHGILGLWFIGAVNKELQDRTKVLVDQYSIDLCKSGFDMNAYADYDLN
jgi:hypothetical protein